MLKDQGCIYFIRPKKYSTFFSFVTRPNIAIVFRIDECVIDVLVTSIAPQSPNMVITMQTIDAHTHIHSVQPQYYLTYEYITKKKTKRGGHKYSLALYHYSVRFMRTVPSATAFTLKIQFSSKNKTQYSVHKSTVGKGMLPQVLRNRYLVRQC